MTISRDILRLTERARTLYHGTVIDNLDSIKEIGLIALKGPFVDQWYGEYEDEGIEIEDILYAADKTDLDKCLTAMTGQISHKLGRHMHDVTDEEIKRYGLLLVMREGEHDFDHRPDSDSDYDEYPIGVEPGDYYIMDGGTRPDLYLTGNAMLRVFKRHGLWPRDWGASDTKTLRQQAIKYGKLKNPKVSQDDIIAQVDRLLEKDPEYLKSFVRSARRSLRNKS